LKVWFTVRKVSKLQISHVADGAYAARLEARGGRPTSTGALLGGLGSLVGGVDPSDSPEDPAVEGLPSPESFLVADFLRAGTPSGHVHFLHPRLSIVSTHISR
jgi:hypothetical protein